MIPHGARRQQSRWDGAFTVLLMLLPVSSSSYALLLPSPYHGGSSLKLRRCNRHPRRPPTPVVGRTRNRKHCSRSQRIYMVNQHDDDKDETRRTTTTPFLFSTTTKKRRNRLSFWPGQSWPKSAFRRRPSAKLKHKTSESTDIQTQRQQRERGSSSASNALAVNSTSPSVNQEQPPFLEHCHTQMYESGIAGTVSIGTDGSNKDMIVSKTSAISPNNNGTIRTLSTPESSLRKWPPNQPALPKEFFNFMPNKAMSKNLVTSAIEKKDSDPVTSEDLERIIERLLLEKGWTRPTTSTKSRLSEELPGLGQPVSDRMVATSSSNVAFPQPSVLNYNSLRWGVTVAAWLCGTLVAVSVHPSLWLVGGLAGSWYGYAAVAGESLAGGVIPTSIVPALLVTMGRRLASWYLQTWDFVTAMFFMYKTGQLSYSMWRQYAQVDERFQIQDKIDAWNAFFVKGKENFDKWEKENEVGRKVLATMRTVWLVEERSLKKSALQRRRRRSQYRLVQAIYDLSYLAGRSFANIVRFLTGGGSSQELSEFLKGVRLDISAARLDSIGSRIGAISSALVAVNIVGALYAISPSFVMMLAVLFSIVWPTWFPELLERCQNLADETRAKGRGEGNDEPTILRTADKSRYHFYINREGRRSYYRVTTNPFRRQQGIATKHRFRWPWERRHPRKQRP